MFVLGLLILIAGLLVSVALHELGHMVPAKKFGAIVPEYWIGFGPTVWETRKGGTTYGVKALPLGGYVRILGMFPPSSGEPVLKPDGSPTLAQAARDETEAELRRARDGGMQGKAFYELTTPHKLVVMFGGPVMNLFLAVLLLAIVIMGIGWSVPSTRIDEVVPATTTASSPAAEAGLQAGDQILSWNGTEIQTWEDFTTRVQAGDGPAEIVVDRGGSPVTVTVTPAVREDGSRYIGVRSALERERGSVGDVASMVGTNLVMTGQAIVALPVNLFTLTRSLFTGEERDPTGVISIVGIARLAGDITAAPGDSGDPSSAGSGLPAGLSVLDRVALLLSLIGSLNLALFAFNLIPLPPLDGGHIVGALWGGMRNAWARVRGKPLPPPADTARMVPLSYAVFGVLMVMTVILVAADLVSPITFA